MTTDLDPPDGDIPDEILRIIHRLAAERRRRGFSQTKLAQLMGTSQSAVSELEKGEVEPRLSTLQRYAAVIGLPPLRTTPVQVPLIRPEGFDELRHQLNTVREATAAETDPDALRQLAAVAIGIASTLLGVAEYNSA